MRTHTAGKNQMNQPAMKKKAPMATAPATKKSKGLGIKGKAGIASKITHTSKNAGAKGKVFSKSKKGKV